MFSSRSKGGYKVDSYDSHTGRVDLEKEAERRGGDIQGDGSHTW